MVIPAVETRRPCTEHKDNRSLCNLHRQFRISDERRRVRLNVDVHLHTRHFRFTPALDSRALFNDTNVILDHMQYRLREDFLGRSDRLVVHQNRTRLLKT
jgi:hypothetical protein